MFGAISFGVILIIFIGTILLQIFLSKRESKWPGLILPIISFVFSFFGSLNMYRDPDYEIGSFVVEVIGGLFLMNIPTFIFLAIYFACRSKYRRNKQLDKMNIQDLT